MNPAPDQHSPKQIAQALGVSESSLKRWCDQGLIQTMRTAGGHRKVLTADVIRFARERGITFVTPELLGLPSMGTAKGFHVGKSASFLAESLLTGNESLCRQIVMNHVLAEHAIARVFDDVIAKAFVEIGELWACNQADVYQERRACEIILRVLAEIRKSQSPDSSTLTACGGTATGDVYSLQTQMAEIVLRDNGYRATSLGSGIPFDSLIRAVHEIRPTLFWVSAAYIADEKHFLSGLVRLSAACAETQSALVIGGRALTASVRETIVDAAYCDNMQQLAGVARTLARVQQRSLANKPQPQKRPSK